MSGSDSDRLDIGLKNLLNKAIELDNRGMKKEACQYYLQASKILIKLSKSTSLPSIRKHYFTRAQECVDRVRYLSGIKKKARGPVDGMQTPPKSDIGAVTESSVSKRSDATPEPDEDSKRLQEMIADTIVTERPNVNLSEVAGLDDAKQAIYDAILAPMKHPELFKGKARQPWRGILLYGPAGCGKTLKTQLLTELQGLASDQNERITLIGATNLPWELDFALRSRFEKRIHVPLPDKRARKEIFKIHIEDVELASEVGFEELASLSEGYSGRDIGVVCREAAMEPIRDLQKTGRMEEDAEILNLRPVSREDFLGAIENIRPATSPEDIKKYIDWAEGS